MTPENMDDLDHALRLAQEQPGGVTHPEITRLREALAAERKARETAEVRLATLTNLSAATNALLSSHATCLRIAEATNATLRAELAKAREALEPFSKAAEPIVSDAKDKWSPDGWIALMRNLTVGDFRRARTAHTSISDGAPKQAVSVKRVPGQPHPLSNRFVRNEAEEAEDAQNDGAPKQEEG
jgi:hypothetical protein